MNSRNPLIPKGSNLEQQQNARSRVKLAVFFVLTIHVVGLLALLMQGCKREEDLPPVSNQPAPPLEAEPVLPTFVPPDSNVIDTSLPEPYEGTPPTGVVPSEPGTVETADVEPAPAPVEEPPSLPTETTMRTYTIQRGDTFYSIAAKFEGVSMRAIAEANQDVDPTRLQVGQVINIPPAQPVGPAPAETTLGSGTPVYTVKSGDNLIKIATRYNTTWKKIMDLNNLSTTQIKVGQKLKIPSTNAVAPDTPGPVGNF